jgi:hypothetical protein
MTDVFYESRVLYKIVTKNGDKIRHSMSDANRVDFDEWCEDHPNWKDLLGVESMEVLRIGTLEQLRPYWKERTYEEELWVFEFDKTIRPNDPHAIPVPPKYQRYGPSGLSGKKDTPLHPVEVWYEGSNPKYIKWRDSSREDMQRWKDEIDGVVSVDDKKMSSDDAIQASLKKNQSERGFFGRLFGKRD